MEILYFVISFLASVAGAICGIGGGVIIKPVLDLAGLAGVSTISFLSGCTVLCMSAYSVTKTLRSGENAISLGTATPLAVGAAAGGVIGKQLFSFLLGLLPDADGVGAVQAACLGAVTLLTFLFTLLKERIPSLHVKSPAACVGIGLVLGVLSSFLGIGGGPINLVVLFFYFGMDTKTAAQNSLYIILFSQITSLLTTLVTRSVPAFSWTALILMAVGGIAGGMAGRVLNRRMDAKAVDRLFLVLMAAIIAICVLNIARFGGL